MPSVLISKYEFSTILQCSHYLFSIQSQSLLGLKIKIYVFICTAIHYNLSIKKLFLI